MHRYEEIAETIRGGIARGEYGPEGRLPSERWFGRTFEAQRNTVRRALGLLEREGQITSVGKSGWYVESAVPTAPRVTSAERRILLVTFRRRSGPSIETLTVGLQEVLTAGGIQMLHYDSPSVADAHHVATIEELTTVDAGGIVMWPHSSIDKSLLLRLQASIPLVLVDRRVFGFECDSVLFDDLGGGRLLTEHLIANGHRRIAYLGDEPFVESVQNRWLGYRRALDAAGITSDENLTVLTHGQQEPTFSANVRILLRELTQPPTAIVCSNDNVASALLLLLRQEGLRVPEDIAVAGIGNVAPGYLDVMGLTSVCQPFTELGRAAGRLLLERLSEPLATRGGRCREVIIPMDLVVRPSSGAHVGGDASPAALPPDLSMLSV